MNHKKKKKIKYHHEKKNFVTGKIISNSSFLLQLTYNSIRKKQTTQKTLFYRSKKCKSEIAVIFIREQ